MMALTLIAAVLLQAAPANTAVVVGLKDGQKLALDNPQFTGFIETREGGDVLLYQQKDFHGQLKLNSILRIDFTYKKGKPYLLGLTLANGQKLNVESDKRDFVMVRGATENGFITIKNPDPISPPVRLSTHTPNRKHDLTIQYLEFPR
jgi:hypothetical protein